MAKESVFSNRLDPDSAKYMNPDPDSVNMDPKHLRQQNLFSSTNRMSHSKGYRSTLNTKAKLGSQSTKVSTMLELVSLINRMGS